MRLVREEAVAAAELFAAVALALQIAFFRESPLVVLRVAFALFFLFVLPGYGLLFAWREKIGPIERALAGTLLGAAVFLILSYYAGFVGIHVNLATWLVPLVGYGAFILQLIAHRGDGKSRAD